MNLYSTLSTHINWSLITKLWDITTRNPRIQLLNKTGTGNHSRLRAYQSTTTVYAWESLLDVTEQEASILWEYKEGVCSGQLPDDVARTQ